MDQKRDELLFSNVKGKNPFKDKRVRQAFYQAIDIDGIKKTVMRGASNPTALMVGPGINGFQPDRTSACRTTWKPPRSCWPRPAIPMALRCP
jgi:ABC-type transport system substrate-binding protein